MPAALQRSARRLRYALVRPGAAGTRRLGAATAVAGGALLVVGLVAGLSAPLVVAIAVGPAAICHAMLIVGPVLPGAHDAHGGPERSRGVRLLGAGVLIAGLSTVGAGVAERFAPAACAGGAPLSVGIPLVGLFAAVGAYLLGLMVMPGVPLTVLGRVRRALDGLAMGVCGFFVAWLLLFAHDGIRGAGLAAVLLSCIAFGAMVIAGLRSAAGRSAALACGGGIALSIAGMTQLAVALDYDGAANRIIGSGAALLAGPVLIRRAAHAVTGGGPTLDPVEGDTDFGGYPLFALPLAAALLAGAYHFVQRRALDSTSIALAVIAVVAVALRGAVASFDARHYAARLTAREAHFRSLFSGSTDVIMVLTPDLLVRWQSPAAARQFGLSDQDVVGRPLVMLVQVEDRERAARYLADAAAGGRQQSDAAAGGRQQSAAAIEVGLRDGFGAWRDVEWRVIDHRGVPAVAALVVHLRDVSERKQLQRTLRRVAFVDQLTGLANRRALGRSLAERASPGVLIVLRLTGLTGVVDARGRGVGDAVLVEAARRIREGVDDGDVPVRLDGDRFGVLTDAAAVAAQFLGTRLLTVLAQPYALPGGPARLSAGAGLAEFTPGVAGDEVLRRAELALRRVGRWDRGDALGWYDDSIEAVVRRQLAIEQALPGLLGRVELDLLYQPIVELATRRPAGVEAMLRWRHPTMGVIPTDEFMSVAERLGLAGEIGGWALRRACRELSGWLRDGYDVWLSLDVAAGQLTDPAFLTSVTAALDDHLVPASRMVIEVGESGLTAARSGSAHDGDELDPGADSRAEAVTSGLTELRSLGVRVALDRYGTASTSLSRLRMLPIDMLKVDRQLFDQSTPGTRPAPAIIDVVVRLGRQLGMTVAAQGLQTEPDLDQALAAGCELGQGDLLCRPVPAEHLEAYLHAHRAPLF